MRRIYNFYFEKVSVQSRLSLEYISMEYWDRTFVLFCWFLGLMTMRDNWGHPYFVVRGEILGFTKDKQLQKH